MSDDPKHNEVPDFTDRDIRIRPIVIFLIVTALVTAGTFVGIRVLLNSYTRSAAEADQPRNVFATNRILPVEPRLQGMAEAAEALALLHARERELLEHYAWVDKDAGVVRMPIEQAMETYLEQQAAPEAAPVAAESEPAAP